MGHRGWGGWGDGEAGEKNFFPLPPATGVSSQYPMPNAVYRLPFPLSPLPKNLSVDVKISATVKF